MPRLGKIILTLILWPSIATAENYDAMRPDTSANRTTNAASIKPGESNNLEAPFAEKPKVFIAFDWSPDGAIAPKGKLSGPDAVIDGIRLETGRNRGLFPSDNGFFAKIGYGTHRAGLFLQVAYSMAPTHFNDKIQRIGPGNTITHGDVYSFTTRGDFIGLTAGFHVVYPKFLNYIFTGPLAILTGGAGLMIGFLDPSVYFDIGLGYNMSFLRYSGDINTTEFFGGASILIGLGFEFNLTDSIALNIGWQSLMGIPVIGGDGAHMGRYRLGAKYYF